MYRIGSGQGFYGEDVTRALAMIVEEQVDAVCFEALSEVTLTILRRDYLANPQRGYTFDIEIIADTILPEAYRRKIPLITNGGGLNPLQAGELVRKSAHKQGLQGLKIAVVSGDCVLARLSELQCDEQLLHLDSGAEPPDFSKLNALTANVYLGSSPIVTALDNGADIVITGRIADPCLYLAPLIHHYRWRMDDWNKLAAGIIAGHLLECTSQVVGGNSLACIDKVPPRQLAHLGLPIAQVEADGSFVLSKTRGSDGCVTVETVKEQLLYEVHDPRRYVTPDVIVDFTTLALQAVDDSVRVTNVTGTPAPSKYKLNITWQQGFMRELIFTLGWPQTRRKVEQLQQMLAEALDDLPLERIDYYYLGINSLYGDLAQLPENPLEIIVRAVFTAAESAPLKQCVRRIMALGLSGPAGMNVSPTTIAQSPRPLLRLWPTLVDKDRIEAKVDYI